MAALIKKLRNWLENTPPGQLVQVAAYTAMLLLTLAFFTGHGAFIYEAF